MSAKPLTLLFVTIAFKTVLLGSDFRTFTDSQGRKILAKLTRVCGEDVFIERKDGLTSKVRILIFSEADQTHIQEWAQVELLKDGALEVRFATDISEQTKFSNARNDNPLLEKTWKESYEIILTNTSFEDFKNIKIEYLIIKFEEALQAQKRNEGRTVEFRGQGSVTNTNE